MAFDELNIRQRELIIDLIEAQLSGNYGHEFHDSSGPEGRFIRLKGVSGNEDKVITGFTEGDLIALLTNYYLVQAPPQSGDALMLGERAFEQYGLLQSASQLRSVVGAKTTDVDARSKEQVVDVFISHSSQDVLIAKALVTLLRSALNLPSKSIRCTSVEGYMFDPGIPVDEQIRREVRQSTIFIGLITPASIRSSYVQFELGARWGAELELFPLLASGADASKLPAPIAGRNALRCDNVAQVHQLIGVIASRLKIELDNPSAYQKCIDELVEASK